MMTAAFSINDIKTANLAAGFHWFDPGTMRYFGTRILRKVYNGPGGVYFVTEDKAGFRDEDGREFNVREFNPETGETGTARAQADPFRTEAAAVAFARQQAEGHGREPVKVAAEEFRPVTILEQFVADCRTHGNATTSPLTCREFIQAAARYDRQCEHECNGTGRRSPRLEQKLRDLGAAVGAKAVVLCGDPRGVTCKLVWHDGATNDFGSEGWCVPTSEKAD